MQQQQQTTLLAAGRERAQWAAYGFIAGILIGLVLGWLFHGAIGAIFSFLIVGAIVAVFVIAFLFYRRTREAIDDFRQPDPQPSVRLNPGETVDTTYSVIGERTESRER